MKLAPKVAILAILVTACSGEDKGVAAPAGGGGGQTGGGAGQLTGGAGGAPGGGGAAPRGGGATAIGGTGGIGGATCTPPAPGGECDNFPQCGCSGGEACTVDPGTGLTKCATPGSTSAFAPCATTAECVAGAACWLGACKPFCEIASDCSASNGVCVLISPTEIKTCTKKCKLEDAAGTCGAGLTCFHDSLRTYTDCGKAGTKVGVVGCTSSSECAAGHTCLAVSGACQKWCRVGHGAQDCPSGKTCEVPGNPPSFDGFTYGYCSL